MLNCGMVRLNWVQFSLSLNQNLNEKQMREFEHEVQFSLSLNQNYS